MSNAAESALPAVDSGALAALLADHRQPVLVEFMAGEGAGWKLDAHRRQSIILAVGNGDGLVHQNRQLSGTLWQKGIGNALREWDGFAHDWPVWAKMLPLYIGGHD